MKQVYWLVGISIDIVAFFVTVETRDHTHLSELFLLLAGLSGLSCIYSGGRSRAISLLSASLVLSLLFFFSNFLRKFRTLGT